MIVCLRRSTPTKSLTDSFCGDLGGFTRPAVYHAFKVCQNRRDLHFSWFHPTPAAIGEGCKTVSRQAAVDRGGRGLLLWRLRALGRLSRLDSLRLRPGPHVQVLHQQRQHHHDGQRNHQPSQKPPQQRSPPVACHARIVAPGIGRLKDDLAQRPEVKQTTNHPRANVCRSPESRRVPHSDRRAARVSWRVLKCLPQDVSSWIAAGSILAEKKKQPCVPFS